MRQLKKEALKHYTSVIKEMDNLNISKNQQIEYLKLRLLNQEYQMRKKMRIERLLFSCVIAALFGFYFIFLKLYLLGILFMIIPSIYVSYSIITLAEENREERKESERKKLISLLDSNLE